MAKRVGIPRALFYYQYYPLWKTFLEELGAEIIVSDFTTKNILDDGVKACVDEACLPVKLFHGHVINLKDRVDYLFIPRFTSVSRNEYVCPKFGGLPDMIRHSIKGLPEIIDVEVNLRKSSSKAEEAALRVGKIFCNKKATIIEAYKKAHESYRAFRKLAKKGILTGESFELYKETKVKKAESKENQYIERKSKSSKDSLHALNIAVLGHVYNLYDNYINKDMLLKLQTENINVITIDMIDGKLIDEKAQYLTKRMFWNFGRKAYGSALQLLEMDNLDGIIYIMSFGCGVDSFVCDVIERKVRQNSDIPFIVFTLDEHSGEAGMDTRLEAYIDMIRWRKRCEMKMDTAVKGGGEPMFKLS